jgi:hypothetical protein
MLIGKDDVVSRVSLDLMMQKAQTAEYCIGPKYNSGTIMYSTLLIGCFLALMQV